MSDEGSGVRGQGSGLPSLQSVAYVARVGGRRYEMAVSEAGRGLQVEIAGRRYVVELEQRAGSTHFRLVVDGRPRMVVIRRLGEDVAVTIGTDQVRVHVDRKLPIDRRSAAAGTSTGPTQVTAPMPGLIVSVDAEPGDRVEQGRPVVIMEAMKMQMEIRAPAAGRVAAVRVSPGQEVAGGQVLAEIEPTR